MAKQAIYSGTFDPITNGHLDVIKKALNIFDKLTIAVATSKSKQPMFSIEQRVKMIKEATKKFDNITVKPFSNLLVEFAQNEKIFNIIRGLRAVSDFEYELQMGYANNSLNKDIETIYFMPSLNNAFVSSSIVRELIKFDGEYAHLVPKEILNDKGKICI